MDVKDRFNGQPIVRLTKPQREIVRTAALIVADVARNLPELIQSLPGESLVEDLNALAKTPLFQEAEAKK